MRVKHILVTTLNRHFKPGSVFTKALDNEWLLARWEIFIKYTVPSVAGQTNLDFEWVVLCHEQSPAWLRERAKTINLPCRVRFSFVHPDPDLKDLKDNSWEAMITTRIDSDDAWHRTAMARIRESFEEDPYTYEILNFEIGYWYDVLNKRIALDMMRPPPFNTKIKLAPITNPLETGGNHGKLRERYSYKEISRGDPLFLRIVHGANNTTRLSPSLSFAPYPVSQYILQQAFNIADPISELDTGHNRSLGRSDTTNDSRIDLLLESVARESKILQLLNKDRRTFKAKFNITDEEIGMLRSANVLSAIGLD